MSYAIIEERLRDYKAESKQQEWNALKEITQEIALYALSRGNFFKVAAFHGGTSLRIIYGLNRFSEDLDFVLLKPDASFVWEPFLKELQLEFSSFGTELKVTDRSDANDVVKKAFLKEDSFGKILQFDHKRTPSDQQKIQIKLEIDTHPPQGSSFETKFVEFPLPFTAVVQDKPSLFAGKCHALLCRPWTKGRDWFDFIWYVSRKSPINYSLLQHALEQIGPWKGQQLQIDKQWLIENLSRKVLEVNWGQAKSDVSQFLQRKDLDTLALWDQRFFQHLIDKLGSYL